MDIRVSFSKHGDHNLFPGTLHWVTTLEMLSQISPWPHWSKNQFPFESQKTKSAGPQQALSPTSGQDKPTRKQGSSERRCIDIDTEVLMKAVVMKINTSMLDGKHEIRQEIYGLNWCRKDISFLILKSSLMPVWWCSWMCGNHAV